SDWLVLLDRADWKLRYLELEPSGKHPLRWSAPEQAKVGKGLRAFEAKFGCKLPPSYQAFAHVFGTGEMGGYFRIKVPYAGAKRYELAYEHETMHEFCTEHQTLLDELQQRALFFASTIGGESVAWDPTVVSDDGLNEYRVCWLDRAHKVFR